MEVNEGKRGKENAGRSAKGGNAKIGERKTNRNEWLEGTKERRELKTGIR